MDDYDGNGIAAKVAELQEQTKLYLSEIKEWLGEFQRPDKESILSYFTYTIIISHDPNQESLCLGSYHITNIGNQPIINPYICIKMPKELPFSFSGKYVYKNFKQALKSSDGWERINEKENNEEYWLKPIGKSTIQPNETISFSNFQIKWTPTKSYSGSIMGFSYSDEMKDGIAVINPINLSGSVAVQEVQDE